MVKLDDNGRPHDTDGNALAAAPRSWHAPLAPIRQSISNQLQPVVCVHMCCDFAILCAPALMMPGRSLIKSRAWHTLPFWWLILWLTGFMVILVLSMTVFIVVRVARRWATHAIVRTERRGGSGPWLLCGPDNVLDGDRSSAQWYGEA